MKTYPSVIRVEYAYALLCERNTDKAARLLSDFEEVAKRYPYESDVESERELIAIADERSRTVL
jgi:CRISPR/Cas system-associated exonuclease Cas4 (RecB family)